MFPKLQALMRKLSQTADIPPDTLCGEPTVLLSGYRQLSVDRHISILEYSEERIVILLHGGELTVSGQKLFLKQMIKERVTVVGVIRSVEIEERA